MGSPLNLALTKPLTHALLAMEDSGAALRLQKFAWMQRLGRTKAMTVRIRIDRQ
jgi:hypothetical protein